MIDELRILSEADSTQDTARELAVSGVPEGTAVMALTQKKGRGRLGRSWISPPGKNVALSLILRPLLEAKAAVLVGLLASVGVVRVLEGIGISGVGLKWPNDVLVGERKIAGILSEASVVDGVIQYLIVGVGINVNGRQSDYPLNLPLEPTSLVICTGKMWDVQEVARKFLKEMGLLYKTLLEKGPDIVAALWKPHWAHRGRMMVCDGIRGVAEGIAHDGALILRNPEGQLSHIVSGEVLLEAHETDDAVK